MSFINRFFQAEDARAQKAAMHATQGNKILKVAYAPSGSPCILVNGKFSPAVNELVGLVGMAEAWRYLTKDCMVAHSAISDRHLKRMVGERDETWTQPLL
jgi:hypothetical protein